MLYPLTGQVYVDRELVDFIKISQRSKEIDVPNGSSEVYIKIGRWKTNIIKLNPAEDGSITLSLDSKIQNGFFIFTILFFVLSMLSIIFSLDMHLGNKYIGIVFLIPLIILVYRQYFEKYIVFLQRIKTV